jgi:hypothetical protein
MTTLGFDWGDMAVERCFEHKGYKCVRVRSMATGLYVDIQLSPKGNRMHISSPKKDKRLAGFDPCGSGKQVFEAIFKRAA